MVTHLHLRVSMFTPRELAHIRLGLEPSPRILPLKLEPCSNCAANGVRLKDDDREFDYPVDRERAPSHSCNFECIPDIRIVHVGLKRKGRRGVIGKFDFERQSHDIPILW